MSYAFEGPQAQASSSLPPTNHPYPHDPYSSEPQNYAPYSAYPDQDPAEYAHRSEHSGSYRDNLGDSYDENPSRAFDRDRINDPYEFADTRAGAGDDRVYHEGGNMASEKADYGSPYAAKRASGNSIWTKNDKRALASRSVPAKICRVLIGNIIIAVIIIVSIICLIVMFLRPPNVAISGISVPSQNGVNYQNGAFAFNVSVDISVSNPNSISASIKKLKATAYDAQDQSAALGHGLVQNQKIRPNANTTVLFPFQIKYDQSEDPNFSILRNIASDCNLNLFGGTSGGSGDLSFLFKIEVDVEVLSITVPVHFNKNISFPCPLSQSSLQGIFGSLLNGGSRRSLMQDAESAPSQAAALTRRQALQANSIDMATWQRDVSPVELMAAAADGLVRRYSTGPSTQINDKRSLADEHDAL